MAQSLLLDVSDSILIAIDIQPTFVKTENKAEPNPLLQRMCWVIEVANWLHVPLIVTAEDIPNSGTIAAEVTRLLPPGTEIFNKMVFGLTAQADILEAIKQTGRKTAVLDRLRNRCLHHTFSFGVAGLGVSCRSRDRCNRLPG